MYLLLTYLVTPSTAPSTGKHSDSFSDNNSSGIIPISPHDGHPSCSAIHFSLSGCVGDILLLEINVYWLTIIGILY